MLDSDKDLWICDWPTHWARRRGGGGSTASAAAFNPSEVESRPVIWPADVVNSRVSCKRADGGALETRFAFRRAVDGCLAELWLRGVCRALSLPCSSSHWNPRVKCRPGLTQADHSYKTLVHLVYRRDKSRDCTDFTRSVVLFLVTAAVMSRFIYLLSQDQHFNTAGIWTRVVCVSQHENKTQNLLMRSN